MRIDTTDTKRDYEEGDSEEDEGGIEDKIKAVSNTPYNIIFIDPYLIMLFAYFLIVRSPCRLHRSGEPLNTRL